MTGKPVIPRAKARADVDLAVKHYAAMLTLRHLVETGPIGLTPNKALNVRLRPKTMFVPLSCYVCERARLSRKTVSVTLHHPANNSIESK